MAIDDLKQLTNLVDSAVEHTNLDELAHEIHVFYANVIRPQGNQLPEWPLDQILEHVRYHIYRGGKSRGGRDLVDIKNGIYLKSIDL